MVDRINAEAAATGDEAKVYVDSHYVYVQLSKGSGWLYTVVPRQANTQEVK